MERTRTARPLFRDLFLKPKGTVDITSSTVHFEEKTGKFVDEASWAPEGGGGCGSVTPSPI